MTNKLHQINLYISMRYNGILSVVFTLLGTGMYYFLYVTGNLTDKVSWADVKFYGVMGVVGLLILLYLLIAKMPRAFSNLLVSVVILLFCMSLMLQNVFLDLFYITLFAKMLGIFGVFLLSFLMISLIFIQTVHPYVINAEEVVLNMQDLQGIKAKLTVFILALVGLICLLIPYRSLIEISAYAGLFLLFLLLVALGNYHRFCQQVYIAPEIPSLEYRSIVLYVKVQQLLEHTYGEKLKAIVAAVDALEEKRLGLQKKRHSLLDLEARKDDLRLQVRQIDDYMSQYDMEQLRLENAQIRGAIEHQSQQIWDTVFATKYQGATNELEQTEQKLELSEAGIVELQQQQAVLANQMTECEAILVKNVQQQKEAKARHTELLAQKDRYQVELSRADIEANEARKIEQKIARLVERMAKIDTEIQQLGTVVMETTAHKDNLEQQQRGIVEHEIPDLQYVVNAMHTKIDQLQTRQTTLRTEYDNMKLEDAVLQKLTIEFNASEEQLTACDEQLALKEQHLIFIHTDYLSEVEKVDSTTQGLNQEINLLEQQKSTGEKTYEEIQRQVTLFQTRKVELLELFEKK